MHMQSNNAFESDAIRRAPHRAPQRGRLELTMTTVDVSVIFIRLLFGAIVGGVLVAFLAVWGLAPLWLGIALPIATGVLAGVFGDKLLVGFMRIFRWLS